MTVSNIFSSGNVVPSTGLNTNFAELSSLAQSIPPGNLQGGIRARDLSDRYAPSYLGVQAIPSTSNASIIAPAGFAIDATPRRVAVLEPTIPEGAEGYLCAVMVSVEEADVNAAQDWSLEVRKDDGTIVGGQAIAIDGGLDDVKYLVANSDFFANPLLAFSAGERFEVFVYDSTDSAIPRGVRVDLTLKTVLSA